MRVILSVILLSTIGLIKPAEAKVFQHSYPRDTVTFENPELNKKAKQRFGNNLDFTLYRIDDSQPYKNNKPILNKLVDFVLPHTDRGYCIKFSGDAQGRQDVGFEVYSKFNSYMQWDVQSHSKGYGDEGDYCFLLMSLREVRSRVFLLDNPKIGKEFTIRDTSDIENSPVLKIIVGGQILMALGLIIGAIWMLYKYCEKLAKIANGED